MDYKVNVDRLYELQGRMSNIDFARKIGIGRTQLWRICKGLSKPGLKFITKFKKAFPDEPLELVFFTNTVEEDGQEA